MSDTRVSVLTPAGAGAIGVLAVVGPAAWESVRAEFRPAGRPLAETPARHDVRFGTFGGEVGDEVVVIVRRTEPETWVEVHGHGGRRVVRWLVERLVGRGCVEVPWPQLPDPWAEPGDGTDARALEPLSRAPTLRTAAVLLDQYHGAFARAFDRAVEAAGRGDFGPAGELARFADLGRHLAEPWKVTIAGPPNVGKSSLANALAGFQRAVVSPVAGTTRDVVTVPLALDGWPVELADTAGLRDAADELEAAGIALARRALGAGDVTVWVFDGSADAPAFPDPDTRSAVRSGRWVNAVNKADLPAGWPRQDLVPDGVPVSAATGDGIPELIAAIVRQLVPEPPAAGAAVPFTPGLADAVEAMARRPGERGR